MKLQETNVHGSSMWLLLDDSLNPIMPVNRYLLFLHNTGRSDNTLRSYAYNLKTYYEYLQLRCIDAITLASGNNDKPLDVLSDFLVWLQHPNILESSNIRFIDVPSKRKTSTVNCIVNTVLSFYDYLARNKEAEPLHIYRDQMDMRSVKPFLYEMSLKRHVIKTSMLNLRNDQQQIEYVTLEMYKAMIDHCYSYRDKAIIGIMYEGGLRIGETLGLRTIDIAVWDNSINIVARKNENHVSVKNKAEGKEYVSPMVMDFLTRYYVYERPSLNSDYVFVNLRGPGKGLPMKEDTVEKLFMRLSRDIDQKVHPHMCRHGCATARLENGWDEVSIQKQLRHVSVSSTRIYEHFRDGLLLEKSRELLVKQQEKIGWKEDND